MTESTTVTLRADTGDTGFNTVDVFLTSNGLDATGSYQLPVLQGDVTLQGEYQPTYSKAIRWYGETDLTVTADSEVDLILYPQGYMADSASDLFNGSADYTLTLDDGASITIPAGTLAADALYHIEMTPGFPYPYADDLRMLDYGYSLEITQRHSDDPVSMPLNGPISVQLPYRPAAPWGQDDPTMIQVAAYSPQSDSWSILTDFELDSVNRMVTVQTAEHTAFALVSSVDNLPAGPPTIFQVKSFMPFLAK